MKNKDKPGSQEDAENRKDDVHCIMMAIPVVTTLILYVLVVLGANP